MAERGYLVSAQHSTRNAEWHHAVLQYPTAARCEACCGSVPAERALTGARGVPWLRGIEKTLK